MPSFAWVTDTVMCTLFHGYNLEQQTLVKQGEQIFIPENVPNAPFNQSQNNCI